MATGARLTLDVPALARSGLVHVLGASTSFELQVVPTLRSVGGAISTGNTIELEGSGLVGPELQIQIDGRGVGSFDVRTIFDSASSASPDTQQLVRLTVPSAVSAGLISVSTAGGTSTLRTGASLSSDANDVPASDVGDTLATARTLALASDHRVSVQATLGDGAQTTKDVDLYRVDLAAGDVLRLSMDGSDFYSHLRVFDAAGVALADQYMAPSGNPPLLFKAPAAGSYTIGVSGYYNTTYDPTQAGSGDNAGYQGAYQLSVERRAAGSSLLSGIQASATHGTPAQAGVAAANVGQTITLTGSQLQANEQLVFTAIDGNGTLYERTVTAASVAANGTSLTVVVPAMPPPARCGSRATRSGCCCRSCPRSTMSAPIQANPSPAAVSRSPAAALPKARAACSSAQPAWPTPRALRGSTCTIATIQTTPRTGPSL